MRHMGTSYKFAHHRTVDGERCLIWGNGIGELLIPVTSIEYAEALGDRGWQDNALVNEGEVEILETYFRALAKKATLYGRLYGAGTPAETATLASAGVTEVAGTGYNPTGQCAWTVGNTDFGAVATGEPSTTTSTTKTFTAGAGGWSAAANLILATSGNASGTPDNTGKLVAWVALSATRTLAATDTLDVSVAVGLS
jgi:hypothetical protein